MKTRIRRHAALFLCLLFVVSFTSVGVHASDPTPTVSNETIARVHEEVLTGNITNHEDVLAVALAEYMSKPRTMAATLSEDSDEPLKITQLIDETTAPDGTPISTYASTALLVLDEEGRSVNATEYYNHHMTGNGGDSGTQIFATHTTFVTAKCTDPTNPFSTQRFFKITSMNTIITCGTAIQATKMQQSYADEADPVGLDYRIEHGPVVTNPVAGTHYPFLPNTSRYLQMAVYGTYIQSYVQIWVGNTSFSICNTLDLNGYFDNLLPGS